MFVMGIPTMNKNDLTRLEPTVIPAIRDFQNFGPKNGNFCPKNSPKSQKFGPKIGPK